MSFEQLRRSNEQAVDVFAKLLRIGEIKLAFRTLIQQLRTIYLLHKRAQYDKLWARVKNKEECLREDIDRLQTKAEKVIFDDIVRGLRDC